MNIQKSRLDPWRVILSHLMEVDSYYIPDIINRTGMMVDWNLSERENYSHKYRRDAFRPRIIAAYQELSESEKLRVLYIIVEELKKMGIKNALNTDLERIGWRIADTGLIPADSNVKELFFPSDSQHDAYVEIRKIFQQSTSTITVIDPYIGSSLYTVLNTISSETLHIRILSFKLPSDFILETSKFLSQNPNFKVEIRKTKEFHDRFVILDDTFCYHLGCSIKDAGKKVFMISRFEDDLNINALKSQTDKTWENAEKVQI